MHYTVPAGKFAEFWTAVDSLCLHNEAQGFARPILMMGAKNVKLHFMRNDPKLTIDTFFNSWTHAFDMQHIPDEEMWVDIAKEINTDTGTHPCAPLHANNSERPMTLLWRMCCLRHKANQFRMKMQKPGNVETYHHWANCRDTGNLTIEPGRRHPLRKLGIVYSQFYSPMKEIFDAAKCFPFDNPGLEGLAVDPTLRNAWANAARATGWDESRVKRSWCESKQRCKRALDTADHKAFGLREEHRVSVALLRQMVQ